MKGWLCRHRAKRMLSDLQPDYTGRVALLVVAAGIVIFLLAVSLS